MSVIVFAETWNKKFKKSSLEAVSYASEIARNMNLKTIAIVIGGSEDLKSLEKYGANKILAIDNIELEDLNNNQLSKYLKLKNKSPFYQYLPFCSTGCISIR